MGRHQAFIAVLFFLGLTSSVAQAQDDQTGSDKLLDQLQFLAIEYVIYTDQLQKFDASPCGALAASQHQVETAEKEVLEALRPKHRPLFEQLFQSSQVSMLRQENSDGIATALGVPSLADLGQELSQQQRNTCAEYALIFQDNLDSTRNDLQSLLEQYRQR